jgi:hypothetical protein
MAYVGYCEVGKWRLFVICVYMCTDRADDFFILAEKYGYSC